MDLRILRYLLIACLVNLFILSTSVVRAGEVSSLVGQMSKTIPFKYSSIFSYYEIFKDQPLRSWQEANDRVGAIGGWRYYAREGQKPAEPTPPFGVMFDTGSAPLPLTPLAPGNQIRIDGGRR